MASKDRKQQLPWLLVALLGLSLVASLLWTVFNDCGDASGVQGSGDSGGQSSLADFTITGNLSRPVTPGVSVPLDLRLTNSAGGAILVSSLNVTVTGVAAPNADASHPCTVRDFTVDQAADGLALRLAASESSSLSALQLPTASWPKVHMRDSPLNQDGCKDARLTLDYTGAGRRAT